MGSANCNSGDVSIPRLFVTLVSGNMRGCISMEYNVAVRQKSSTNIYRINMGGFTGCHPFHLVVGWCLQIFAWSVLLTCDWHNLSSCLWVRFTTSPPILGYLAGQEWASIADSAKEVIIWSWWFPVQDAFNTSILYASSNVYLFPDLQHQLITLTLFPNIHIAIILTVIVGFDSGIAAPVWSVIWEGTNRFIDYDLMFIYF